MDSSDTPLYELALDNENGHEGYSYLWAGLEGSRIYHADCNFSGAFEGDLFDDDETAFNNLVELECCATQLCPGDVDVDFDTDLSDLAVLLSHFGDSDDPTRGEGDLDADGDVDLADLASLLANFGTNCCAPPPNPLISNPTITVPGYDTGYYASGGFNGEKDHWVFDVLVEMADEDDDWLGAGVKVTTANGATFRIVGGAANPPIPGSGLPNRYRCFFSTPFAVADSNRYDYPLTTGRMKGKYNPLGSTRVYSTSELNANWYDAGVSDDGPAAIMRIVIDASGVSGISTSNFGDVYFTTGSPGSGDIKVADFTIAVYHLGGDGTPTTLTGAFYAVD